MFPLKHLLSSKFMDSDATPMYEAPFVVEISIYFPT